MTKSTLAAFQGAITKDRVLTSLRQHREKDRIVQGTYWSKGRGCSVGCMLHDFFPGREDDLGLFPEAFGIPEDLAHLNDIIFEGLPVEYALDWPLRFITAIPIGVDLSRVPDHFMLWLLSGTTGPLSDHVKDVAVKSVATLYRERLSGSEPSRVLWEAARSTARDAFAARDSARDFAAWSATSGAEAARDAAFAARGAALDFAAMAFAARDGAMDFAARGAALAEAAMDADRHAARDAAETDAAWKVMADRLCRIIEDTTRGA